MYETYTRACCSIHFYAEYFVRGEISLLQAWFASISQESILCDWPLQIRPGWCVSLWSGLSRCPPVSLKKQWSQPRALCIIDFVPSCLSPLFFTLSFILSVIAWVRSSCMRVHPTFGGLKMLSLVRFIAAYRLKITPWFDLIYRQTVDLLCASTEITSTGTIADDQCQLRK